MSTLLISTFYLAIILCSYKTICRYMIGTKQTYYERYGQIPGTYKLKIKNKSYVKLTIFTIHTTQTCFM